MITVEKCPCGFKGCRDYHLVGIGKFVQGSGFTKEEAEQIAALLNVQQEDTVVRPDGGEVELLPLPDAELSTDMHINGHGDEAYSEDQMQAYARANVERALAPQQPEKGEG